MEGKQKGLGMDGYGGGGGVVGKFVASVPVGRAIHGGKKKKKKNMGGKGSILDVLGVRDGSWAGAVSLGVRGII